MFFSEQSLAFYFVLVFTEFMKNLFLVDIDGIRTDKSYSFTPKKNQLKSVLITKLSSLIQKLY